MAVRAEEVALRGLVDETVPSARHAVDGDRESLSAWIAVMEDQRRHVTGVAAADTTPAVQLKETRFGSATPFDDRARPAL